MPLNDLLLPEFDDEIRKTRTTLERLPEDLPTYKPHEKSAPLAELAGHVAQLPSFLTAMLTTPEFDFATAGLQPYVMTTRDALLATFDTFSVAARAQLAETADRTFHENWKLSAGDHVIFTGSRYHAARALFFNHLVHHRAQLGVYLRLNNIPVPSIYGPSADESS